MSDKIFLKNVKKGGAMKDEKKFSPLITLNTVFKLP